MKKLLIIAAVLLSVSSYGQDKQSLHPTIGVLGGFTTNRLSPSMMRGAWVNFEKVGIEAKRGRIKNEEDMNIGTFNNLGVFVPIFSIRNNKDANVFVSAGAQFVENYSEGSSKKSQNAYAGFGIDFSFGGNNKAVIRTEVQFSKISTVGLGVGYKF